MRLLPARHRHRLLRGPRSVAHEHPVPGASLDSRRQCKKQYQEDEISVLLDINLSPGKIIKVIQKQYIV